VATPGTLAGLAAALERWGSLPLARLIAPAIEFAAGDLELNPFFARRLAQHCTKLAADPTSAATYLPGGQVLGEGDYLRQPDLGRALRLIAVEGPAALYGGEIGRALVAAVQRRGGRLTLNDLTTYQVAWRRPLIGRYRQYELRTMPPPGAGLTGMYLLAESHLTCHTYPEHGVATFNLHCCRARPRWGWEAALRQALGATTVTVRELRRGGGA